jgi:solute carrier family 35 protein F5
MLDLRLTGRHILGIAILGIVVTLWVASSFLMRSIFGADKTYDKPFFVTWINTATFSFYLIPWAIRSLFSTAKPKQDQGAGQAAHTTHVHDHGARYDRLSTEDSVFKPDLDDVNEER